MSVKISLLAFLFFTSLSCTTLSEVSNKTNQRHIAGQGEPTRLTLSLYDIKLSHIEILINEAILELDPSNETNQQKLEISHLQLDRAVLRTNLQVLAMEQEIKSLETKLSTLREDSEKTQALLKTVDAFSEFVINPDSAVSKWAPHTIDINDRPRNIFRDHYNPVVYGLEEQKDFTELCGNNLKINDLISYIKSNNDGLLDNIFQKCSNIASGKTILTLISNRSPAIFNGPYFSSFGFKIQSTNDYSFPERYNCAKHSFGGNSILSCPKINLIAIYWGS